VAIAVLRKKEVTLKIARKETRKTHTSYVFRGDASKGFHSEWCGSALREKEATQRSKKPPRTIFEGSLKSFMERLKLGFFVTRVSDEGVRRGRRGAESQPLGEGGEKGGREQFCL